MDENQEPTKEDPWSPLPREQMLLVWIGGLVLGLGFWGSLAWLVFR